MAEFNSDAALGRQEGGVETRKDFASFTIATSGPLNGNGNNSPVVSWEEEQAGAGTFSAIGWQRPFNETVKDDHTGLWVVHHDERGRFKELFSCKINFINMTDQKIKVVMAFPVSNVLDRTQVYDTASRTVVELEPKGTKLMREKKSKGKVRSIPISKDAGGAFFGENQLSKTSEASAYYTAGNIYNIVLFGYYVVVGERTGSGAQVDEGQPIVQVEVTVKYSTYEENDTVENGEVMFVKPRHDKWSYPSGTVVRDPWPVFSVLGMGSISALNRDPVYAPAIYIPDVDSSQDFSMLSIWYDSDAGELVVSESSSSIVPWVAPGMPKDRAIVPVGGVVMTGKSGADGFVLQPSAEQSFTWADDVGRWQMGVGLLLGVSPTADVKMCDVAMNKGWTSYTLDNDDTRFSQVGGQISAWRPRENGILAILGFVSILVKAAIAVVGGAKKLRRKGKK